MTIPEFHHKYFFHDSFFENVVFNAENCTVEMIVNFCFWMQSDFQKGDVENGYLKIKFQGVRLYSSGGENIDYENAGILQTKVKNGIIIFELFDDLNNMYYELSIGADAVDVVEIKNSDENF